LVLDRNFSNP